MKLKICIILTILLSATFGYAQPKLITREELDKREVKEFIDHFMKSFNESKNFETMPSRFFSKNFKLNMIESNYSFSESKQIKELTVDQQFEYGILIRQLLYFSFRNTLSYENKGLSISEDNNYQSFPPDVLEILKRSKVIIELLDIKVEEKTDDDEDNEDDEITSAYIVQSIEIIRNAIALFKIYDDNQETFSEETVKKLSELEESSYEVTRCKNNGKCFGMSDKTRIYWKTTFPLCLHLVRENGELRVFYVDFNFGD
jgi:hypothetical protein